MAWEDRPHYRDRSGASTNPLRWLLGGSVPLGSLFGVRIRAHSALIVFIVAMLCLDSSHPVAVRAFSMGLWVFFVILHELAHCAVARRFGGQGDEALLWPLGGLTAAEPPQRPGATCMTALAGPLLNLALCAASASAVLAMSPAAAHSAAHIFPANPFNGPEGPVRWSNPAFYFSWVFLINYRLFLLNLLPIYPLDGARVMQTALWPMVGHFRSMMMEATVGVVTAIAMGLVTLAMQKYLLTLCMVFCCFEAYQYRVLLHESMPEDWKDSFDFSSSLFAEERPRRKRLSRRVIRRARKISQQEKAARDRIDQILAKVSAGGLSSLTWGERRVLKKTTQQQQRRENEMSKFR